MHATRKTFSARASKDDDDLIQAFPARNFEAQHDRARYSDYKNVDYEHLGRDAEGIHIALHRRYPRRRPSVRLVDSTNTLRSPSQTRHPKDSVST